MISVQERSKTRARQYRGPHAMALQRLDKVTRLQRFFPKRIDEAKEDESGQRQITDRGAMHHSRRSGICGRGNRLYHQRRDQPQKHTGSGKFPGGPEAPCSQRPIARAGNPERHRQSKQLRGKPPRARSCPSREVSARPQPSLGPTPPCSFCCPAGSTSSSFTLLPAGPRIRSAHSFIDLPSVAAPSIF